MSPLVREVVAWITARHPEVGTIDPDHDLIESRLVDSLRLVELIILIERLTGRPVDVDTLDIADLRSLNSLDRAFSVRS